MSSRCSYWTGASAPMTGEFGRFSGLVWRTEGYSCRAARLPPSTFLSTPPAGLRNFPESTVVHAPRIGEVYTKGTLTLARLGREAPIAALSPSGAVLRNVEGGSLAARLLYPSVRHQAPERLPVSPVIGADAPEQYERREDIGAPRKRMPSES